MCAADREVSAEQLAVRCSLIRASEKQRTGTGTYATRDDKAMKNKRSMIDTAWGVGRSLRCLTRGIVVLPGERREEAESNSRLDFGVTSIFLYALIAELTIKGLWLSENCGAEDGTSRDNMGP